MLLKTKQKHESKIKVEKLGKTAFPAYSKDYSGCAAFREDDTSSGNEN